MPILQEMQALMEKHPPKIHPEMKPGEKMVFGKVVKIGVTPEPKKKRKARKKMDPKTKFKKGRQRKRARSAGSKKGYGKEVDRQIAHNKSRGVKKVKGAKESIDILSEILDLLQEKVSLKPGEKMVFGKVVKVKKGGKMDGKTSFKKGRQRKRSRSAGSKKGYKKEVQRQVDHNKSRGVKKVRGAKESIDVRLADIAFRLQELMT
jgi:hypothetical protein